MAARLQPRHIDEVRSKIKASQLINALQNRALGKNKMDAVAVQAARIALAKVIPDCKDVTIRGDAENPLHHVHTITLSAGEFKPGHPAATEAR